jgi:hypothetical protein
MWARSFYAGKAQRNESGAGENAEWVVKASRKIMQRSRFEEKNNEFMRALSINKFVVPSFHDELGNG